MEQGLLHLYWGDGKGKTTAAMGLALRALGSGKRVIIVQFLKGGNSGEIPLLAQLGAEIYRGKAGQKFVFLVSIMADKDVDEMLALLLPLRKRRPSSTSSWLRLALPRCRSSRLLRRSPVWA